MDKYSILKQYYGHTAFRAGQEALIDAILAGRDALCIMPTGGGKSLCYQIPALLLPGITLVISPLISLMKDQVAALKSAGVPAAYINSSLTPEQIRTVYARTRKGAYKLIYVAPERLETSSFLSLMQEMDVSFLAVDEGTAFRSGDRTSARATSALSTLSTPCRAVPSSRPTPPRRQSRCSPTSCGFCSWKTPTAS